MTISNTGKLVAGFVLLIIGIVFISQIAEIGQTVTVKKVISGESHVVAPTIDTGWDGISINETITYTITQAPTSWKIDNCPITNFVLSNATDDFTETTDYVFTASTGTYTLVNSTTALATITTGTNNTLVSYTYCGDDYINLSWGRTGINLVAGFFALALLLTSIGLFYSIAKENGIIN